MQAPLNASSVFAPLPLRPRSVLETLDTAIKVYRRYFWVLIAWSSLVIGLSYGVGVVGMLLSIRAASNSLLGYASFEQAILQMGSTTFLAFGLGFFLWPCIVGSVACTIAAAVRGTPITFAQCWQFTRPRYWAILGNVTLAVIVGWMAMGGLAFAGFMVAGIIVLALGSVVGNHILWLGAIGIVMSYGAFVIMGLMFWTWILVVSIVLCMEDQYRNSSAMNRAWNLLRGRWRQAIGLLMLMGMGLTIVCVIILLMLMMVIPFGGLQSMVSESSPNTVASVMAMAATILVNAFMSIFTTPVFFLTAALLYLDLRVRKEALDVEWSAHTATEAAPMRPATTDYSSPQTAFGNTTPQAPPFNSGFSTAPPQPPANQPLSFPNSNVWPPAHTQPHPSLVNFAKPEDNAPPVPNVPQSTITCPQCGASAAADQTFCMQCGHRLRTQNTSF